MAEDRTPDVVAGCSVVEVEVVVEVDVGCEIPVCPSAPELDLGSCGCVDTVPGGVRSVL